MSNTLTEHRSYGGDAMEALIWSQYARKYRPCVLPVILNKDNQALFVHSTKATEKGEYGWSLPQEGIEQGETFHKAIRRCLREELALILPDQSLKTMRDLGYFSLNSVNSSFSRDDYSKGKQYFAFQLDVDNDINFNLTLSDGENDAAGFFSIESVLGEVELLAQEDSKYMNRAKKLSFIAGRLALVDER